MSGMMNNKQIMDLLEQACDKYWTCIDCPFFSNVFLPCTDLKTNIALFLDGVLYDE